MRLESRGLLKREVCRRKWINFNFCHKSCSQVTNEFYCFLISFACKCPPFVRWEPIVALLLPSLLLLLSNRNSHLIYDFSLRKEELYSPLWVYHDLFYEFGLSFSRLFALLVDKRSFLISNNFVKRLYDRLFCEGIPSSQVTATSRLECHCRHSHPFLSRLTSGLCSYAVYWCRFREERKFLSKCFCSDYDDDDALKSLLDLFYASHFFLQSKKTSSSIYRILGEKIW